MSPFALLLLSLSVRYNSTQSFITIRSIIKACRDHNVPLSDGLDKAQALGLMPALASQYHLEIKASGSD